MRWSRTPRSAPLRAPERALPRRGGRDGTSSAGPVPRAEVSPLLRELVAHSTRRRAAAAPTNEACLAALILDELRPRRRCAWASRCPTTSACASSARRCWRRRRAGARWSSGRARSAPACARWRACSAASWARASCSGASSAALARGDPWRRASCRWPPSPPSSATPARAPSRPWCGARWAHRRRSSSPELPGASPARGAGDARATHVLQHSSICRENRQLPRT